MSTIKEQAICIAPVTITICENTMRELENYNRYREASRRAQEAESDALRSGDEKAFHRARREATKAAKAYCNASMSLGWFFAGKLRDAGIEVSS